MSEFNFIGSVDEAMKIKTSWEDSVRVYEGQIDQLYSRLAAVDKFLDANTIQICL